MNISNNILKECLKNVYFINGTAYAGKSTMVRMLADKHGMIHCGENYHSALSEGVASPRHQPNISYFKTMSSWQEFISRTPQEYAWWIDRTSEEAAEFEVALLLRLSAQGKKIIADTNISVETLREISDYNRVAIMLSPPKMSVDMFFMRGDTDKQFLLRQIEQSEDPEKAMENFRACIAEIHRPQVMDKFKNSGFFTIFRRDAFIDTRKETLMTLEKHFGLTGSP